jgi:hypothetical protein
LHFAILEANGSRAEIHSIFVPVFDEIKRLISSQMNTVKANSKAQIKVPPRGSWVDQTIFLVGGLGSNEYLIEFLKKNFRSAKVDIQRPSFVHSAIMRGAVLHGLGLNQIRERVMRTSYGVAANPVFVANRHPLNRRFVDVDGVTRCKEVMDWFTRRVVSRLL